MDPATEIADLAAQIAAVSALERHAGLLSSSRDPRRKLWAARKQIELREELARLENAHQALSADGATLPLGDRRGFAHLVDVQGKVDAELETFTRRGQTASRLAHNQEKAGSTPAAANHSST